MINLQTFLATMPGIYPSGRVTGYFGGLTQQAVEKFQFKYGIIGSADDPGYGIVGPRTRAKINAMVAVGRSIANAADHPHAGAFQLWRQKSQFHP